MAALYKLLRMKLLFRLAARISKNGDWALHYYSFHNYISHIPAPVGKPNVGWCFILTATPPGIDFSPNFVTQGPAPVGRPHGSQACRPVFLTVPSVPSSGADGTGRPEPVPSSPRTGTGPS